VKVPSILFIALSSCFISACSTFTDVHYDKRALEHNNNVTANELLATQQSGVMALSALLSVDEANQLIELALQNNPSLKQALLTLKTAEQQLTQSEASLWPSATYGVTANKLGNSTASYDASLDVSWSLDIWQRFSNSASAQSATVAATAFAYQGARDLLTANVMKAYLGLVQYSQLIAIETERVATYQTNEKVIVNRYRKGLVELSDLDTAKSSTQSSQATLVDYKNQYQQALRNLALLTGVQDNSLDYRTVFPEVLVPLATLEPQNLSRRPDLKQAYQTILANQYQHKVAYKALLPNLSLTASLGNGSTNLHEALFGSNAWQLLGQLSAPIFNAGKLKSEVEVAKINAEKSYWAFQQTLLTAVNEVDNAVAQESTLTQRLALTESALASAKRSAVTNTERYRKGSVSLIDLLQVQQQTFSLQVQVTQLTYQRLVNRITLGLALGLGD